MRTELVICEKTYKPAEFTFGNLRKLDKMGINPIEFGDRPISAIASYVALTAECTLTEADELIEKHLTSGGDLNDISEALTEALNESGFFQAMLGKTKKAKKKQ